MFEVWTYLHGNSVVSQLTFVRSWCWKFEHLQGSNYVINFICHKVSSYKHLRGSSHLLINFHLHGYLQVINICARTAFEKLEFTQLYKSYDFSSQRLLLKIEQTIVKFNFQQYKNQRHLRILSPSKDKEGCSVYVFVLSVAKLCNPREATPVLINKNYFRLLASKVRVLATLFLCV